MLVVNSSFYHKGKAYLENSTIGDTVLSAKFKDKLLSLQIVRNQTELETSEVTNETTTDPADTDATDTTGGA